MKELKEAKELLKTIHLILNHPKLSDNEKVCQIKHSYELTQEESNDDYN